MLFHYVPFLWLDRKCSTLSMLTASNFIFSPIWTSLPRLSSRWGYHRQVIRQPVQACITFTKVRCTNPFPTLDKRPPSRCLDLSSLIIHHWQFVGTTAQGSAGDDCPSPLMENKVSRTSRQMANFPISSPGHSLNTNTWQYMGEGTSLSPWSSAIIMGGW